MSYDLVLSRLERLSLMEQQRVPKDEWVREGQEVTRILCENESLLMDNDDFEHLMHYVADYDIRLKDPIYGQTQLDGVAEIIRELSARRDNK